MLLEANSAVRLRLTSLLDKLRAGAGRFAAKATPSAASGPAGPGSLGSASAPARPRSRGGRYRRSQLAFVYTILIPLLAIFLIFQIWPIVKLLDLSLRNWGQVIAGQPSFAGLANFARMVADPIFWRVLGNTFEFTALRVPAGMVLGLVLALAIQRTLRLRGFYLAAFFSPYTTSIAAMALVFTYFYHPVYGLFNSILQQLGLPTMRFLSSTTEALPSIVLVDLWKTIGFTVVIFVAGLEGIPREFDDAAAVDGASAWQRFRYITFPMLLPTTYLLLLTNVISAMRVFVPVFMMTSITGNTRGTLGGPLNSTNVLTVYMYQSAFHYNDFGYASAIAMVLFFIVLGFTALQLRTLRVTWEY